MTQATPHGTVYVIGSTNIDTVLSVARHPRVGETLTATGIATFPGGKGANQAAAAAQSGARTVFVTRVGDDDGAARYREHLRRRGADLDRVGTAPGPTGQASIVVDAEGQNTIIVVPGANAFLGADAVADLDGVIGPGDVISLQLEVPLEVVRAALELARRSGATSLLNPSPWREDVLDLVAAADIVVVNEEEAAQLGEDDDRVVRTLGADGARWGDVTATAPRIHAVDTTGAGDAFTGSLAAALVLGASHAEALQSAVDAATAACLRPGAQQWAQDES
ncbi:ribokinase [Microbacterium gorillae]|uniref:ribokinase n=1 Tax=Microbacterium gorillae TaxID=1231063 RepID=UPI00058D7BDA|nr:ribokinase [Microbacterium gorillae]